MEAKEKAKELVKKFMVIMGKHDKQITSVPNTIVAFRHSKECAIFCVDEMIEQNGELYLKGINEDYYKKKNAFLFEVKQEIEKL